ncbi:MAG TPA: MYXO-CTERM sorting domain-containing protein [Byssovorax sp.]
MRNPVAAILSSLLLLACLFVPLRSAFAAGTATPSTREPVEEDGKWKLKFTIGVGSPPALPHVPMLFVFTQTVLYERSLTDKTGDKPITNRLSLQNQQPINESLDVDFSDGAGKVFATTKFDFVIRRDRGFEAGEYDLKIKREGDGVQIGQTIKLTLKGDNPVVDRRAMVFAGEKKKDKSAADKKDDKKDDAAGAPATPPGGDPPPDETPAPPHVEPKQGGCGCRVDGDAPDGHAAAIAAVALAAAFAARRRRRAAGAAEVRS